MSKQRGGGTPPSDSLSNNSNLVENQVENNDQLLLANNNIGHNANSNQSSETTKPVILYSKTDKGPFTVYLESTEKVGFQVGKVNNIKIARDIFNLNLKDVKRVNNKGSNRISIEFLNFNAANCFVNNQILLDKGYKLYIPYNFVTAKGIARRVDQDISDEELIKCCCTTGDISILNAKRLNRKVIHDDKSITYEPTGTVLFTFKGVNIPQAVHFYNLRFDISVYISPVTQCFRCLRYGHTRVACKGKERCFDCGKFKHNELDERSSCEIACFYCKGNHRSTSKGCPEYSRQKNIKELIALENLTFFEASEFCRKTYISQDDFVVNKKDFPLLNGKPNNMHLSQSESEMVSKPSERRTLAFKNNPVKRSFTQVLSSNPSKKRIIQKSYDKSAHNSNLYFPNGRPQYGPSQSWISQRENHSHQNSKPSTSATSDSYYSDNSKNINFDAVIQFLRNATLEQSNIVMEMLQSGWGLGSYMDLDQASDD